MKKVILQTFLLTLFSFGVATVFSCQKEKAITEIKTVENGSSDIEIPDWIDNEIVEEEADTLADVVDYDPEAATKIVSITGTQATDADGSSDCMYFKYKDYWKVRTAYGNVLTITLSQPDTIVRIIETSDRAVTGVYFDSLVQISPTVVQVILKAHFDTVRVKTAKLSLLTNKQKIVAKSLKTVGMIGSKCYGHSFWIVRYWRIREGTINQMVSAPIELDSNYIPQRGDIIVFSNVHYGAIITIPVYEQKLKAGDYWKQYRFKMAEMNAKGCKSSKSTKSIKLRNDDIEGTLVSSNPNRDPPVYYFRNQ
jgi:hypothetical protein